MHEWVESEKYFTLQLALRDFHTGEPICFGLGYLHLLNDLSPIGFCYPRSLYPGLHQKKRGQQVEGGDSTSTLLWWDPTWSPVSSSRAVRTGKTWSCRRRSRGVPQKWSVGWNTPPVKKGWKSWGSSAWRRAGCGETSLQPFSTQRGPTTELERGFLQGYDRTRDNGFKLK